ncbi:MAG: DUF2378 family protein [Myxococcota bacterium]
MGPASKLVFSSSVEPLLKVTPWDRLSSATRQQLAAMRISPSHKLEPAYPAQDWAKAVKLISGELFRGLEPDVQHRELGQATVQQFTEGFLGKAMFTAARLVGARRVLERMSHNLRSGANYLDAKLTVVDERSWELWLSDVTDVPGFYAGILSAGVGKLEGWPDRIEIKQRDGDACWYSLQRTS